LAREKITLQLPEKIAEQSAQPDRKAYCQQPPWPSRCALAVHSLKEASAATIVLIQHSPNSLFLFSDCCALSGPAAPRMEEIKTDPINTLSRQTVEKFGNPRLLLSDQLTLDVPPPEIQS
jgi:hypothetical protein